MRLANFTNTILLSVLVVIVLIYGKAILLPLVLAVMVWLLIRSIRCWIAKIKWRDASIPRWIQNGLVFFLIFSSLGVIGKMLSVNITNMSEALPTYQQNVTHIMLEVNQLLDIDIAALLEDYSGKIDVSATMKIVFNSISEIFGNAFMVVLYVLFLMLEEKFFSQKITAIAAKSDKQEKTNQILKDLDESVNSYILLKTLVSLITGLLSYVTLEIIGVDFAFFWAFIIFLLNYIPTIGSLVATVFPAVMALVQSGETSPFFLVLLCIGGIQLIVGNIVEPKIMGNSLNISSLVVIVALTFWGTIWGVVGMILSVPVTVMMIIVFAQFEKTRNIAILLSESGKLYKE